MPVRLRRRIALTLHRYPLLPFLLAATVAAGLVIATIQQSPHVWWGAYAYAVTGLLGVWASQLRAGWSRRIPCAGLAVVAVSLIGLLRVSKPAWSRSLTILLTYFVIVTVGAAAVRFVAGQFGQHRGRQKAPISYSLFGLLTTTTLVAVLSAIFRHADPPPQTTVFALIYVVWGILPLAALLIVRSALRPVVSFAAISFSSLLVGYAFVALLQVPDEYWLSTVAQGFFYAAWLQGLQSRTRKPQPAKAAT